MTKCTELLTAAEGEIESLNRTLQAKRKEIARLRALLDGAVDSQECNGYIGVQLMEEIKAALGSKHAAWCNLKRPIPHGALAERGPCNCKGWTK
jgi:hypothetical protein